MFYSPDRMVQGGGRRRGGNTLVCLTFFSHATDGIADGISSLVFRDRLSENEFGAEPKCGGQTGTAIDNRDRNGVDAVFSAAADVKDELGGGKIFAIDQNQVEALRIELLGGGDSVQGTLARH